MRSIETLDALRRKRLARAAQIGANGRIKAAPDRCCATSARLEAAELQIQLLKKPCTGHGPRHVVLRAHYNRSALRTQ
jgi:hypothetical protein